MKIRSLEDAFWFRASVLAEKYDIPIEKARLLKTGGIVDVSADEARRLIGAGLAEALDAVPEISETADTDETSSDKDKEDL